MKTIYKKDFEGTIFEPLLELTDCPKHMHFTGHLPDKQTTRFITVVGSRAHTAYAQQALEYLLAGLVGHPICIVSGLALGIDALAHRLAIQHSILTVAIPGSGLDRSVMYPATNLSLADQIVGQGGALLSEFEPADRAARWTFPKRNRIMAAISDLVLVVEAGAKSGTLITARNALEYNTDVAVIPSSIFSETGQGSNDLLRHGAHAVLLPTDILDLLGITHVPKPTIYTDVSTDEQYLLSKLTEPHTRDELLELTQLDSQSLSTFISLLEIKGHVTERLGTIQKT